jgi:hypothetical protein
MNVEIQDRGEFYEIRNLASVAGVMQIADALPAMQDKPIFFVLDLENVDPMPFYRLLLTKGKIKMTHVVFEKVKS